MLQCTTKKHQILDAIKPILEKGKINIFCISNCKTRGVLRNRLNESVVLKITSRLNDYENYLADVFKYFRKYYPIDDVSWITSKIKNES